MSDWIKVHRRLLESDVFSNPITLKVWIWLLLKANFKDRHSSIKIGKGWEDVFIKRGQLLFGRNLGSEQLKMASSCLYRHIKKLEKLRKISVKSNNHYSVITICKYELYQSGLSQSEQPTGQQIGQPMVQQIGQQIGQQPDTYKKDNKEKNEKESQERVNGNHAHVNSNFNRQPIIPTKDQVWEVFSRGGGTKEMAKSFFEQHEGTGWFLRGSPITNFSSLANKFIDSWKRNDASKLPADATKTKINLK